MKDLTNEEQSMILKKMLEEMNYAEKNLSLLGFSWLEKCYGTRSNDFSEISDNELNLIQEKYGNHYNLVDYANTKTNSFLPLKSLKYKDDYNGKKYLFEFQDVYWYGVNNKRSKRKFDFHNNGDIYFEKGWIGNLSSKRPKGISYNILYNILDNNYEIEYFEENFNNNVCNDITFCYKDNELFIKLNNIGIIEKIDSNTKNINITKFRQRGRYNISIELLVNLNSDNSIETAELVANVKKKREDKIVKYIFKVEDDNLKAYHIEDNVSTDITNDSKLLDLATNLIIGGEESLTSDFIIIYQFLQSFLKAVKENNNEKKTLSNNLKDSFEFTNEIKEKVINTLKEIKGEIPLKEFSERFDKSLCKGKQKSIEQNI